MRLYPDITRGEIRYRLADPKIFIKLRTKTFSKHKGIYALIGRKPGKRPTTVQSLRFKRRKGWTAQSARKWIEQKYFGGNPAHINDPIKIYDYILAIYAVKSPQSNFPKEKFVHKFSRKTKAAVYGLSDGSLLIKGKQPLWKYFEYSKRDL